MIDHTVAVSPGTDEPIMSPPHDYAYLLPCPLVRHPSPRPLNGGATAFIDGYPSISRSIIMDADFVTSLRCPIDPFREATLTRDQQELICDRCTVRYPVRNGIPILIIHEATLPYGCPSRHQLPCRVRTGQ